MKTDLNYLPKRKQRELHRIVELILAIHATVELIILFGSYARNDWVEDKYDEVHYRYQSDFDLLVIIKEQSEHFQSRMERDIEAKLDLDESIKTPVSILVHDVEFINRRLRKAQYFFSDIKKEGVFLYDSGRHQLAESEELSPKERKGLARDNFQYYFEKADVFKTLALHCEEIGHLNEATFLLHQATERLYAGILLVFGHYKPNTHDLRVLRKLVNSVDPRMGHIFPLKNPDDQYLFKLLRKAYVGARYNRRYRIAPSELKTLIEQVGRLRALGERLCQEKISKL